MVQRQMEMTHLSNGKRPSYAYELAIIRPWRSRFADKIRLRHPVLRATVGEFFATFFLMVFIQATIAGRILARRQDDILLISVGQGLSLTLAVFVGGGVSGALLNPAVTVAFSMLGKLSWITTGFFIIVQYLGSFLASIAVYAVFYEHFNKFDGGNRTTYGPNATAGVFSTFPGDHRSVGGALFHEIFTTAFLTIGVFAIIDDKNWKPEKGVIPLALGALLMLIVAGLGYGEALAMNPARDLAPRLFTLATHGIEVFSYWNYNWFWIPVIGPHVGAVLGGLLYAVFTEIHHPRDDT